MLGKKIVTLVISTLFTVGLTDTAIASINSSTTLNSYSPIISSSPAVITAPANRAQWITPSLENPIVWSPSNSNATLTAPSDRDVLVQWGSSPLDISGGVKIYGGRNIVSIGGTVNFSNRYFPIGSEDANANRCLYIAGNSKTSLPRTVHIEGLHCAGSNIWEGINIDSKAERQTLTVQMRDIRIDQINADLPGPVGKHIGGDALQVWNGPHQLFIDGFTAKNLSYQGFFFQPYQYGSGQLGNWDIRNVNLEGSASGSAYLMWLVGSRNSANADGIGMSLTNVYVQPSPGKTRERTLWQSNDDWYDVLIGKPVTDYVP